MITMVKASKARSKLDTRQKLQATIYKAKRLHRARVWEEKGGKVINKTYKRDNIPNGQLCVLYVSPQGKQFRSWKQCVEYMGEDPLASIEWKDVSSNLEETSAAADYDIHSAEAQTLPWKKTVAAGRSSSTDPTTPEGKGSLSNGDGYLIKKAQSLNVISSSSEEEDESHATKRPPPPAVSHFPDRQPVISISPSKELEKETGSSSSYSSSSSSSGRSISPAPATSPSVYVKSASSSSSSEEISGLKDGEIDMFDGLIHSQDSHEKLDVQSFPPGPSAVVRDEDHRPDHRGVMGRISPGARHFLSNGEVELREKDAENVSPTLRPNTIPDPVIHHADGNAETSSPAARDVCTVMQNRGQKEAGNVSKAAAVESTADVLEFLREKVEGSKRRNVCEGVDVEDAQEEGREGPKTQRTQIDRGEASSEASLSSHEPRRPGSGSNDKMKKPGNESDSQGEQSSGEAERNFKDLTWKMVEEATKTRKCRGPSSKKKSGKEPSRRRDGTCCRQGPTIIVVCPCTMRKSHK